MSVRRLDDVLAEVMGRSAHGGIPDDVRLRRGLERDGDTHRDLWLDSMATERQFFVDDATRTRSDLRVDGNSDIAHDQESEVVLLD